MSIRLTPITGKGWPFVCSQTYTEASPMVSTDRDCSVSAARSTTRAVSRRARRTVVAPTRAATISANPLPTRAATQTGSAHAGNSFCAASLAPLTAYPSPMSVPSSAQPS